MKVLFIYTVTVPFNQGCTIDMQLLVKTVRLLYRIPDGSHGKSIGFKHAKFHDGP